MPWYGWAYLGLLCLSGAGGFVAGLRAGRARLAFLHLPAVTVLAWGVALYFRGEGAGIAHGLALLCAIAVSARKSFADIRLGQREQLAHAGRPGAAIGQLLRVPGRLPWWPPTWAKRGGS